MVDRARLESVCIERYRGFESLSLRQEKCTTVRERVNQVFTRFFVLCSLRLGALGSMFLYLNRDP